MLAREDRVALLGRYRGLGRHPHSDRLVLDELATFADPETMLATTHLQTIADRSGVPKRTVIRALGRLQDAGMIATLAGGPGRGRCNVWRVHVVAADPGVDAPLELQPADGDQLRITRRLKGATVATNTAGGKGATVTGKGVTVAPIAVVNRETGETPVPPLDLDAVCELIKATHDPASPGRRRGRQRDQARADAAVADTAARLGVSGLCVRQALGAGALTPDAVLAHWRRWFTRQEAV